MHWLAALCLYVAIAIAAHHVLRDRPPDEISHTVPVVMALVWPLTFAAVIAVALGGAIQLLLDMRAVRREPAWKHEVAASALAALRGGTR